MTEQRSEEWFELRRGKITASRFADVMAVSRSGKPLKAREDYMLELLHERASGQPKQQINSRSLYWGREVEEFARQAYELEAGLLVTESGFITHHQYEYIGGSPDGLVGHDGLIEIKSPHDEKVHIRTWLYGMPGDHMPQIQGNLMCTGRKWLDFISYDPRAGEQYRLYVQRIERDNDYINNSLLPGLIQFEMELRALEAELHKRLEAA